jgi:DNA polymerase-3 subunit delta
MGAFYLFSGDDDMAMKTATRELMVSLCGTEPEQCPELETIAGDTEESRDRKPEHIVAELLNALRTPPFLTADKKIWLKHFNYFDKLQEAGAKTPLGAAAEELTAFLKQGLPEDITLVVDGLGIDQRKTFFKTCKAIPGAKIEFFKKTRLEDKDKKGYTESQTERIQAICAKLGKKIDFRSVEFLSAAAGTDTGRLINEIEKVACYVGDRENIAIADCRAVCSHTPEALGYEFSNALLDRNTAGALELIDTLIEQMKSQREGGSGMELNLLSSAVRGFQELIKTRCAAAELGVQNNVGKGFFDSIRKEDYPGNYLAGLHPFRAYMLCKKALSFSPPELAGILEQILLANRALVSGTGEPRMVLEQLVLKICNSAQNSRRR